jgi:hypothetical protein
LFGLQEGTGLEAGEVSEEEPKIRIDMNIRTTYISSWFCDIVYCIRASIGTSWGQGVSELAAVSIRDEIIWPP